MNAFYGKEERAKRTHLYRKENKRNEIREKEIHLEINNLNMIVFDANLKHMVAMLLKGPGASNLICLMFRFYHIDTFKEFCKLTKDCIVSLQRVDNNNRSIALESRHVLGLMDMVKYQKLFFMMETIHYHSKWIELYQYYI